MKTRHLIACLTSILLLSTQNIKADEITIEAKNTDISENLELTAVANLFGQVKNLEEFEQRLNDSENQLSNLDLNNDGEVDYLRVVEEVENNLHIIIIQAILAEDIYQDVATILVEKETKTKTTSVQVIGDPYIYGENYIIEPVYIYTPVIYDYFWVAYYHPWYSPYYWGYYPPYYHHHHCIYAHLYHQHIYEYNRHHHCSYRYAHAPRPAYREVRPAISRRDYAKANPTQSFSARQTNPQIQNKRSLQMANRSTAQSVRTARPAVTSSRTGNTTAKATTSRSASNSTARVSSQRTTDTRAKATSTTQRSTSTATRTSVSTSSSRNSMPRTSVSRSATTTTRSTSGVRTSSSSRSNGSSYRSASSSSSRSSSSGRSASSSSSSRSSSSSSRSSNTRR